jgi:hypothetical protein
MSRLRIGLTQRRKGAKGIVVALWLAVGALPSVHGDEIRIDIDKPGVAKDGAPQAEVETDVGIVWPRPRDPSLPAPKDEPVGAKVRVRPQIRNGEFSVLVHVSGNLQKLQPTTIAIDTQQKGRWADATFDVGRYLKAEFKPDSPTASRVDSVLKIDPAAGERRFNQERDAIQKQVQRQAGGRDAKAQTALRKQLMIERIAAIRAENIEAGADRRGKATSQAPVLPRPPYDFEKPDVVERLLREECAWQSVADVFRETGLAPPDEKQHPEFGVAAAMAGEIYQALMGVRVESKVEAVKPAGGKPDSRLAQRLLTDTQNNALADGNHFELTARFTPEPAGGPDRLWKLAPSVRLHDGVIKRVQLEGGLDRERGPSVAWWRVECDTPKKLDLELPKGGGDCFWTWVATDDEHVRYLRLLLHSPTTRYRANLSLNSATKGADVTLYDGPFAAPAKGPF